jgi:hypothetical protein
VLIFFWGVHDLAAGQLILHCSDGFGDDGSGKHVVHSGYEAGAHEARLGRMLCQYAPGMWQLEESEASHRVADGVTG